MTGPIRIGAVYIKPENRPAGYKIHKFVTENGGAPQEACFTLSGLAVSNEKALKYVRAA